MVFIWYFFVGYWFLFVYYFSDLELPFKSKVIFNKTVKQQSGIIINRHIFPKN